MIVFAIVAVAAIGAAVGVSVHNKNDKSKASTCGGNLAGAACNAYGKDIDSLTLTVTYETGKEN